MSKAFSILVLGTLAVSAAFAGETRFEISYPASAAMKGHCYSGPENSADRLKEMGEHIMAHMPAGTMADWWKQ
jgi:hypothetical protein